MQWLVGDVTQTTFDDGKFACCIDKGTLDAIFTENTFENIEVVHRMFSEILRVLRTGGVYVCISLAQSHILKELAHYFIDTCSVDVYHVKHEKEGLNNNKSEKGLGSQLPVFAFVFTKFAEDHQHSINFYANGIGSASSLLTSSEQIIHNANSLQGYAILQNKLRRSNLDEITSVELWSDNTTIKEPRYTITIVDGPNDRKFPNGKYAVFIVPQGRETEWVFSSQKGRRDVAEQAGFQRLAFALLHRGHEYSDIEQVKSELSSRVMELAPPGLSQKEIVPFLTAGSNIGYRKVLQEGSLPIVGNYIVQDVQAEDQSFRRQLIYRKDKDVVQTEAKLVNARTKSNKKKKVKDRVVDHSYLTEEIYQSLLVGLLFINGTESLKQASEIRILMIGLGGGCFPSFLAKTFPEFLITCVDLDNEVKKIAEKWFDFDSSEKMKFVGMDGLRYLEEVVKHDSIDQFDMIVLDVPMTDDDGNIRSPAGSFLTQHALEKVNTLLKPGGVFAINAAQPGLSQTKKLKKILKGSFGTCYNAELGLRHFPVFCLSKNRSVEVSLEDLESESKIMFKYICAHPGHAGKLSKENMNIMEVAEDLNEIKVS